MKCLICGTKDRINFSKRSDICDECLSSGAGMDEENEEER